VAEATQDAVQVSEPGGVAESFEIVRGLAEKHVTPTCSGQDGFPIYPKDPLGRWQQKLNKYLEEVGKASNWRIQPKEFPTGVAILSTSKQEMLLTLRAIVARNLFYSQRRAGLLGVANRTFGMLAALMRSTNPGSNRELNPVEFGSLASELLRKNLPLTEADLISLVRITAKQEADGYGFQNLPNEGVLRAVESFADQEGSPPALGEALREWHKRLGHARRLLGHAGRISNAARKLLTRLDNLLNRDAEPRIEPGEAWSNAALADLGEMPDPERRHWFKLLNHCKKAETSKPTKKWSRTANELVETIGRDALKPRLLKWFDLVALPRPIRVGLSDPLAPDPDLLITDGNSVMLKGLVWTCAGYEDVEIARALSGLAQVCLKKIRNLGARCPRVANACLYVLSVTRSEEAAAELTRLDQVVKQRAAKGLIGKSLERAAQLSGQTREDLEESTVPTYGLDESGMIKQTLGNFTAEFCISGAEALQLRWRKPDGKQQKSIPSEVKENHATELKTLKRTIQDVERMLLAQNQRIERLLVSEREWEFDKWRARYLSHPLLAPSVTRLIWHFREGERQVAGIWHNGKFIDNQERPLEWLSSKTLVRLWHPLRQEIQMVASWRRWLEDHQVTQPFKQAHREIYILTDAEQHTATYSNRFAAHIIRQHQFAALARERGWTYQLMGAFDSHNTPTLLLPRWDLAAEFWVDSPAGHEGTSASGIYLHISTDQVRFCDLTGIPRPLTEVPALVFSEVMRDVDLFVGVCSIGNDPVWQDSGEAGAFGNYWYRYSFGDLSATAKTRREVLERLLPKLKIASQCSFNDKSLVVRGSLGTYKIHLGSSNIQMEPNNQYLCIVPDRGSAARETEKLFLPFDGDRTLSVILSKAFLLAEDNKIKDQTILNQIRRI